MHPYVVERERTVAEGRAIPASAKETLSIDVVRRAFEAFEAADAVGLRKILAPNVRYRVAPAGRFTGDYRGVPAVLEFFAQIARESEGTFRARPVEMAATDDRIFVLYKVSGRRGAKSLESADVGVFTVAGGVVTEATFYQSDYPAHAAFWS